MFGKNKKTNMAGTAAVLTGVGGLAACFAAGHVDFHCIIASLLATITGVGLFNAKDNDVTGGTVQQ